MLGALSTLESLSLSFERFTGERRAPLLCFGTYRKLLHCVLESMPRNHNEKHTTGVHLKICATSLLPEFLQIVLDDVSCARRRGVGEYTGVLEA